MALLYSVIWLNFTVRFTGASETEANEHISELRQRDTERFALEISGGLFAGRDLVLKNLADRD